MDALTIARTELLSHLSAFNAAADDAAPSSEIPALIETMIPLSPIKDPARQSQAVAGGWTSLFARFGAGHSKGRSHKEPSTLSLQTFKAFPETPIQVVEIAQEIGDEGLFYNNVVLFETLGGLPGVVVIHGTWTADPQDPRRFLVVFHGAEVRPGTGADPAAFRAALGLEAEAPLHRAFKPAKLHSDVVYLDETLRINYGGMGGVYVLARRDGPLISVGDA